ncbi:MAG: toll/interleukin-1 receptor domain-containing protein, partial [bacterium]
MIDIFLSYSRSDKVIARTFAMALEEEGWSVWWDPKIPAGKTFDSIIEDQLENSRCVIVLWSENSVNSDWVRIEASEGKQRGILVPVLIDKVKIPLEFKRIQCANLIKWSGDKSNKEFRFLIDAIIEITGPPVSVTRSIQRDAIPKKPINQKLKELNLLVRLKNKWKSNKIAGSLLLFIIFSLLVLIIYSKIPSKEKIINPSNIHEIRTVLPKIKEKYLN